MRIVPLSSIIISDRQRKSFGDRALSDLAADIALHGLYHPLVVHAEPDGYFRLLAGERRLRAIKTLTSSFICDGQPISPDFAPITLFEDLSPHEQAEIELHENLLRADLSWQEQEAAVARLHFLRLEQNPQQTAKQTAEELVAVKGGSTPAQQNRVARAMLIAQHATTPAIRNAKTASRAQQAILRSLEAELSNQLARRRPISSQHTFHSGDLRDILPQLPGYSFDVILADPPYGMGADAFGRTTTQHHYDDSFLHAMALTRHILSEGFRLAKSQAFLFLFCDIDSFIHLRTEAASAGWTPWRTPLVWDKVSHGIEPIPHQGFGRTYELILYAVKGERARAESSGDVLHVPRVSVPGHSAAKPPDLYRQLLSRSGNPGDTVLDPCCGVGTIFHAARALNWLATGIELDATSAPIAEAASRGTAISEPTS